MLRSYLAVAVLCSAVTACGGDTKKDEKKVEAKAPAKAAEPEKAAAKPEEPAKPVAPAAPAAPAAPVDPATFVAADLSGVATLAPYTINGPPGATVTPDEVSFGKDAPMGVVIAKDGFKLHVWRGTIGGERSTMPMRGQMEGFKYSETKNEGEKGLLEYAIEKDGKTSVGYIQAKFSSLKDESVLCGNADPVADAAALEPYKKACESLAAKKK
ncbi:hypothetical protein [Nannocystis sp.]|nr:hypothetical protein [Nannocystis sp.]MBK7830584.1 hypothetical protein [Nannocystis sp.]MBK9756110.1 hypothetical protein [Nannocystis sp.]